RGGVRFALPSGIRRKATKNRARLSCMARLQSAQGSGNRGRPTREAMMSSAQLTRRRALQMAVAAASGVAAPAVWRAAEAATPDGRLVLAWHTNIATRWLDPQQHDGTATPDNFLHALHDGLIKNSGTEKFDHPALAERYEFAED